MKRNVKRQMAQCPDRNDVVHIPLTRGLFAIVDSADAPLVNQFNWRAKVDPHATYAKRQMRRADGGWTTQSMHAFLMGCPLVDHINGDGLDNRRSNLRPVTPAQNARYAKKSSWRKTSSRFKGVTWLGKDRRWIATITASGRQIYLGRFLLEADAAKAYDTAARKYFGEFAALNFPYVGERSALSGELVPK